MQIALLQSDIFTLSQMLMRHIDTKYVVHVQFTVINVNVTIKKTTIDFIFTHQTYEFSKWELFAFLSKRTVFIDWIGNWNYHSLWWISIENNNFPLHSNVRNDDYRYYCDLIFPFTISVKICVDAFVICFGLSVSLFFLLSASDSWCITKDKPG